MSLLDSILNALNPAAPIEKLLGVPTNLASQAEAGVDTVQSGVKDASTIVTNAGKTISSVGDFLSYIAWIFHPLNLLRVAEFLAGLNFFIVGIYLLTRRGGRGGGATSSPIIRRAIQASPAGRTLRVRQGARMEARQSEINRNARQQ